VDARELLQAELARRGVGYPATRWPGRYEIRAGGLLVRVSLDNLARQLSGDGRDADRVAWARSSSASTPARRAIGTYTGRPGASNGR
jgi:hypothetical protein